jgi:hypothetical protein
VRRALAFLRFVCKFIVAICKSTRLTLEITDKLLLLLQLIVQFDGENEKSENKPYVIRRGQNQQQKNHE